MKNDLKEQGRQDTNAGFGWSICVVGVVAALLVTAYVAQFAVRLRLPISSEPSHWGAFGDYIGGIVNPLVAFMALLWLVRSVRLQRTELTATKKALQDAAEAQRDQVLLSAKTAQISAVSTMLQSVQSEIEQLEARRDVLGAALAGEGIATGIGGNILGTSGLTVEMEQLKIQLTQLYGYRTSHRSTLDRENGEIARLLQAANVKSEQSTTTPASTPV